MLLGATKGDLSEIEEESEAPDTADEKRSRNRQLLLRLHPLDIHTAGDEDFVDRARAAVTAIQEEEEEEEALAAVDDAVAQDADTTVNTILDFLQSERAAAATDTIETGYAADSNDTAGFVPGLVAAASVSAMGERRPSVRDIFVTDGDMEEDGDTASVMEDELDEAATLALPTSSSSPAEEDFQLRSEPVIEHTLEYDAIGNIVFETVVERKVNTLYFLNIKIASSAWLTRGELYG